MNLEDVAERLGKSKRTVLRMVDTGRFPHPTIRKGKLIIWSDSVIKHWSKEHRRKEQTDEGDRPNRKCVAARRGVHARPRRD